MQIGPEHGVLEGIDSGFQTEEVVFENAWKQLSQGMNMIKAIYKAYRMISMAPALRMRDSHEAFRPKIKAVVSWK